MAKTPKSAQQGDTAKISYEDREGNKYDETHGDPEENLTVKSKAEQEGKTQPNLEGTTPDPHNPELTEWEQERRGLTEEATAPTSDEGSSSSRSSGGTSSSQSRS